MASAPRPTVSLSKLSKVPSVKRLSEELGIQHASLKDSTVFMDTIHAFRKSCTTSNGSLVATLVDWNLPSVQKELRRAAVKFLDDNGNGERFWNPTRPWAQPSDLHYPQHKDSIIDLLVQLFWKQNRYLNNNSRYNAKSTDSHSRGGSADQSTPAREVHEQSATSPSTTSFHAQKRKSENKMSTAPTRPAKVATTSPVNAQGADWRGVAATHRPPEFDDMYDVPQSSDGQDAPKQPLTSSQTGKHSRNERPDYESEARKRKKHQVEDSPRRTERKRHPRSLPETVPLEVVNKLLDMEDAEAEMGPSSPLSGVHILSAENYLRDRLFAAPTAAMISTQRPTAPQPSLSTDQPAPSTKVVRLKISHSDRIQKAKKLPPNHNAGVSSTTSHTKVEKAALGELASADLKQNITASENCPKSTPTSPQSPRRAETISSPDDNDLESPSFPRDDSGLSLQVKSLSTNGAYSVPPRKPLPSVQSTTASNPERKLPTTKRPHTTPETSTVSQTLSQPSTPVPRPRIQIPFWIITREPLYTEELWNEGKFQGLLLSDFLDGITKVTQRGTNIEKIKLTLRTPFSNTILTVYADAEDAWTTAKAAFAEKLKESRAEARTKGVDDSAGYKILIEPFYEQVAITGGGAEADDDVFDY
ncbi:hypothetical protein NA56DRAFT_753312 [Hyaloscypha hepaticicola]|uniref:Uncharacterized protein n=1 Tax=Hyaloscypha hepaticicola TaxID=2082293 RepID=A0A2J6PQA2_9HELO|nr:hypothetical protein NA56DRAFT_753312 [Hyaloscypha hepaticicola]